MWKKKNNYELHNLKVKELLSNCAIVQCDIYFQIIQSISEKINCG